jgi:type I restriction enzyme, S subunit
MKPSGVEWLGDVPGHWSVGPLKHYWQITDCKHLTAEFVDDGYPLASIREVQGKWVSLDSAKRTTPSFYKQLIEGGRDPRPGDLIFSRNATVGEVAQVPSEHPAFAMGQDVVLLRRTDQSSWPDYLQFVIKSPPFSAQLDVLMIGSTFRRINVAEIATCVVPWPTSDEQRQISDYLNDLTARFDSATREAHVSIALLKERRSALISAAVTGQIDVRGLVPEAVA